eukprot:347175-Pyramimonas_sp.AAC.1
MRSNEKSSRSPSPDHKVPRYKDARHQDLKIAEYHETAQRPKTQDTDRMTCGSWLMAHPWPMTHE